MYKYKRNVTSLQNRIYRASRKGDEKKVRDLQRQLMNSYSALVLAIDRVTKKNTLKIVRLIFVYFTR